MARTAAAALVLSVPAAAVTTSLNPKPATNLSIACVVELQLRQLTSGEEDGSSVLGKRPPPVGCRIGSHHSGSFE